MSFEIAAAVPVAPAAGAAAPAQVQVGYGVSLTDIGGFQQALQGAQLRLDVRPPDNAAATAQQLMKPFEHINNEAAKISAEATAAKNAGREMTPSEVVMLTVRCQEFMFHCQLTSNIANRTADGLQQLFRQQA